MCVCVRVCLFVSVSTSVLLGVGGQVLGKGVCAFESRGLLKTESGYPKDVGVAIHPIKLLQPIGPRFLTGILTWSVGRGISFR